MPAFAAAYGIGDWACGRRAADDDTVMMFPLARACDASNATWIVNRLESRGLAERREKPGDRRVKLVVLTPTGVKTRDRLLAAMYEPPPQLLELPGVALRALKTATEALPGNAV